MANSIGESLDNTKKIMKLNNLIPQIQQLVSSKKLGTTAAEQLAYQRMAGEAIFEIGKRLKHVKENDLVHGEFGKWCEKTLGFNRSVAAKFIKIADELENSNVSMSTHLGMDALYAIATMPEEQRTESHTIPSTGETKTVDEMTIRELREVKKQLKEKEEYENSKYF